MNRNKCIFNIDLLSPEMQKTKNIVIKIYPDVAEVCIINSSFWH